MVMIQSTQEELLEQRVLKIADVVKRVKQLEQDYAESQAQDKIDIQDPEKTTVQWGIKVLMYSKTPEILTQLNNSREDYWTSLTEFQKTCSWAKRMGIDTSDYQARAVELAGNDYIRMARTNLRGGI